MAREPDKIPVSERALVQRINRALKPEGKALIKQNRGPYHIRDGKRILEWDVSVVKLAREMELLQPWEGLKEKP